MEYRLKVLDNEENEKKISDLIIETRASVNKFKVRNQVYRVSIGYSAYCHFQKYFSFIMAVSFIGGGNWSKS